MTATRWTEAGKLQQPQSHPAAAPSSSNLTQKLFKLASFFVFFCRFLGAFLHQLVCTTHTFCFFPLLPLLNKWRLADVCHWIMLCADGRTSHLPSSWSHLRQETNIFLLQQPLKFYTKPSLGVLSSWGEREALRYGQSVLDVFCGGTETVMFLFPKWSHSHALVLISINCATISSCTCSCFGCSDGDFTANVSVSLTKSWFHPSPWWVMKNYQCVQKTRWILFSSYFQQ